MIATLPDYNPKDTERGMEASVVLISAVFVFLAAGASAQEVKVNYNHAIDFTQFHSYAWGKQPNPKQLKNPRSAKEAQDRTSSILASRGLKMVNESDNPDLVVVASGASQEKTTYSNYDPSGTIFTAGTDYGTPQQQLVGAMVVDLYDVKVKKVVWRANALGVTSQKNFNKNRELVDKAVTKMFERFPYSPAM